MKKFNDLIKEFLHEDLISGGKSSGKTIEEIAKKHGVSVKSIEDQIKMGVKVEAEHTTNKDVAKEIAMDHLDEFPNYYTELSKTETRMKKQLGEMMSADVVGGGGGSGGTGYGGAVGNSDWYAPGDARMPKSIMPMIRRGGVGSPKKKKVKKITALSK